LWKLNRLTRTVIHLSFRTKRIKSLVRAFAETVEGKTILEVGSGRVVDGESQSVAHFFKPTNNVLQSDIRPEFGHHLIDVTKMDFEEEFDVILCLNVLEHVYEYEAAIKNMHRSLKTSGLLVLALPVFYPFHDEPNDFYRFTEHALRRLLRGFQIKTWKRAGPREFPFWYYIEAQKAP
jgi:SAM-dependent methyltransferase